MSRRPVFVDIDEAICNIDLAQIEAQITLATRAIIPVHYAGQGAEMGAIMDIAPKHNLCIVEDADQGLGASYEDKPLGTTGTGLYH